MDIFVSDPFILLFTILEEYFYRWPEMLIPDT